MALALGIDVGSTTAKVVVADPRGRILWARCERHAGRPNALVDAMLRDAHEATGAVLEAWTGTLGTALGAAEGSPVVHEVHAVSLAVRARVPEARTVVELGGQDAKVLWLDGERTASAMNDRCAAGTGATLDRIARRLSLTEDDVRAARPSAGLRVTARCGVFAENDAVNLVQRGVARDAVLGAVARGIVAQSLASLMRGRTPRPPVVLLGGPHVHVPALAEAWRDALAGLWERVPAEDELVVPSDGQLYAALGAALHVLAGGDTLAVVRGVTTGERALPPLVESAADAAAVEAMAAVLRSGDAVSPLRHGRAVYVGLDAGTTTCKAVALDDGGAVCATSYVASTGDAVADARAALDALGPPGRAAAGLGVTGYGAALVAAALGAGTTVVESDAHARGARALAPETDVVVDVGGTDVKVLRLGADGVASFHVSSQCAAGHGAFVAATAAELGVPVEDIAALALGARHAPRFAIGCAIFMDTDRVTFQRDGHDPASILAGLAWAVARSVWEHVVGVPPARLGRRFLLTGGAHRNLAVAWAQARHLRERVRGAEVRLAPRPELVGALGAALAARDGGAAGWRATHAEVVRSAAPACAGCELGCARTRVDVVRESGVEPLVLGGACERGATVDTGRRTKKHAADLFDDDARRMFRPVLAAAPFPRSPRTPVVAIPRVLGLYRCAPLLLAYLRAAGLPDTHVRLGDATSTALVDASRARAGNDPCFPAKSVVAHVDALLRTHAERPFDVLLLPAITHASVDVHGTADTASCPLVAACGHTALAALRRDGDPLASLGVRVVQPLLTLTQPERLDEQLFACFGPLLGIDRARHADALAHARLAARTYRAQLAERGARVLARARRDGRAVAVVLSRPYHADAGLSHGVSMELAARGVPVLGITSLPAGDRALLDLSGVMPALTNSGSAEKLWAARAVAADETLLAVDVSSFRCGQDASVLGPLSDVLDRAGKPWLAVHDLDEQRPAASLRMRALTFVAAVRRYEARALARRVA